jgi:acyl CoA:acetate/3-ketoacid CoA transferase beta subunit
VVVTDLGVLRPDPVTSELVMVELHPGVTAEQAVASTGWPLQLAPSLGTTPAPTLEELDVLRTLQAA